MVPYVQPGTAGDVDNVPSISVNETADSCCSLAFRSHASSQVSIPGLDWDSQVYINYYSELTLLH